MVYLKLSIRRMIERHKGESPTIHLQGMGKIKAKPVAEFKPGEFMGWNYGYATKVQRIEERGKMANVYFEGYSKPRRMKLDRLAAIADESWNVTNE